MTKRYYVKRLNIPNNHQHTHVVMLDLTNIKKGSGSVSTGQVFSGTWRECQDKLKELKKGVQNNG